MVLAHMRLLARVGPDVNRQGASLDETFATVWCIALVWSFIGVDAVVSLQIRLAVEALDVV